MNLLIIDDERELTQLYEALLEGYGYQVTTTFHGKEGIELFDKNQFDVVITDKKMPKLDGLQVIKHIEKTRPQTPIVFITGDSVEKVDFQNEKSRLMKKPVQIEELLEHLKTL